MALVATIATMAIAQPAHAQSLTAADHVVQDLLAQKALLATDKVWLAQDADEPSTRDIAIADTFSKALTARGLAVMGNVGMAQVPAEGGFQVQLDTLRAMGVTKLLSFGQRDDLGNLTVRIVEVPGGWLKHVSTVNLGSGAVAAAPGTVTIGPTGDRVIPSERLIPWNPRHGVGLQYSSLSGSGASYRHWTESGWGYQIAGIPALAYNQNQISGFVNLGLQAMRTVLKTDRLRLFTLLGIGALYQPNLKRSRYDDATQAFVSQTGEAWDVGIAPGLGVDYLIHDRFVLTGALGYTFSRQSFSAETPSYAYSPGLTLGTLIEW
jgi:hypothetical protein